ncbi:MAG TPA: hypothetical protein VFS97_11670 [Nitrososphaeraceae archaeon]|nr:hypothetical protein [Nitrososphaeraceae archaeon]
MASATSSSAGAGSRSKQYRCEMCSKSFDSSDTLDSHKSLDHGKSGRSQSPAGVG